MTVARSAWLGPYRAITSARFRMLLQYRAAAIAGLWTQIVFGLVLIMIYEAFYQSAPDAVRPMTFSQVASYVWLGQALLAMLPWNTDPELRAMVKSGAVAYELCRPIDLYGLWYARAVAQRTAPTILRAVPMAVFASVVLPLLGLGAWRLAPPASLAAGAGFVAAIASAIALACAVSTLIHVSLLWTVVADGAVIVVTTAVQFLSGILIPLPMFPDWAQPVLRWLPFAGLLDLPFRVYTGHIPPDELALVLARQLGWTLVLVVAGRKLLARGLSRVVVQGG
ncbi:MAG TPA: ABC-2 family transporter protein [Kofleriaceae bacterium]|nr:ABC-2 family transporter protein [Kofleriaceae bacterium]